jgi:phosphoribosylamine-glycine ligase
MMNTEPDTPLPDKTAAVLEAKKGWQTAMSKATRRKTKAAEVHNMTMETAREKTLTKQNAAWVKKDHQLTMKNYCDVKT